MTAYPPKKLSEVTKSTATAIIAAGMGSYDAYFICGNCESLQVYEIKSEYERYRIARCTACGEEVDWGGKNRAARKVCPKCKERYRSTDFYCRYCSPRTKLENDLESRY